ncbi:serine/threonine-protein kinase STE20 isoform X1 [Drosophila mojavensis]|uniref:serine/threonine-protein kinase STE20 isoform X1 n=1 Tax=Drosophila mojavensis TaxID=7230 RepID=UPI00017C95A6|nr:serine/threonine-protein kinase STE20 isoform X1 [Drosophila mojavensis]
MFALFGAALLLSLQATLAPAQLITLRDGKVGVNFAGFHADAGLGGLLTGNAAHGGLSASAGTPWGSRAAAGIGGGLNGRTAGGAYAAAQANDDVGASALLGGSVGEHGYIGSEAHANGRKASHSVNLGTKPVSADSETVEDAPPVIPTAGPTTYVQKVKPPKKYSLIAQNSDHIAPNQINENHAETAAAPATEQAPSPVIIVKRPRLHVKRLRQRQRNVYITQAAQQPQQQEEQQQQEKEEQETVAEPAKTQSSPKSEAKAVHKSAKGPRQGTQGIRHHVVSPQAQGVVGQALDIPIGILRSLQMSLGGLVGGHAAAAQPNDQPQLG